MIRISQIKVLPEDSSDVLIKKAAKTLGIKESDIEKVHFIKQSIDARKKPEIYYSCVVDVELTAAKQALEGKIIRRCKADQVSLAQDDAYIFPASYLEEKPEKPPVIIGMGPAGLFCGYFLAKHGYCPILIERGKDVDARTEDVLHFWETGELNPQSNVQFGEGGAGTFSDGKLNTLVKDKDGRNREVLKILVEHGAPEKILYDAKPHIGTDVLARVVKNIRQDILHFGGEVHFGTEMTELVFETECSENNLTTGSAANPNMMKDRRKLRGIRIRQDGKERMIECEQVVLAIGHSARNTFETLYRQNVPMEAKAFAVGLRVEHPQIMINKSQYGRENPGVLGAAPYKVAAKTSLGRGVYSFCMCPGGYVVNASSEEGMLAVNGMSYSDRGASKANSAIIVAVTPTDFRSEHPLAGIYFQRELEQKAYRAGSGHIPVQRYGDFRAAVSPEKIYVEEETCEQSHMLSQPCTKGSYEFADLTGILPEECNLAFVEGMEQFGRMIQGFDHPDTLLLGVESRTSSPVRINRDERLQSEICGLYPCGEGAGYAGGITSAAMDGIRVAEVVAEEIVKAKKSI